MKRTTSTHKNRLRAAAFALVVSVIATGCSSNGANESEVTTAVAGVAGAGRVVVSAVNDPANSVVLEKDAAGSTHIDATQASAQLLTLLKAGDGEAISVGKTAYVRDTKRVLDAGATRGVWVVTDARDPLMHEMDEYMLEPTALLFGEGGVYEELTSAKFSKEGDSWSVTTKRGVVTVKLRDGNLSEVKDAELEVRFGWLDPAIRVPANVAKNEEIKKIVGTGQANQRLGGVAQMAIGFQRSAAMIAGVMAQKPAGVGASTRNAAAVITAITPPPGQAGNKGVFVKISGPNAPITVWDGEKAIKSGGIDQLKPQWLQVTTTTGSACLRLGEPEGTLGVSPTGVYRAGEQVVKAELSKSPDSWALVALATGADAACNSVSGAGKGW